MLFGVTSISRFPSLLFLRLLSADSFLCAPVPTPNTPILRM